MRPSLPNGPTTNSLPSPNPSLHPTRPHLGPHRALCPPQPLANGPVGPGTHGHSDSLPVGSNSSNNQSGPTATGPNGDVPYLQPAGSGDAALLPHTCTSTQTQDAAPRQALHLNSSQVRHHSVFIFFFLWQNILCLPKNYYSLWQVLYCSAKKRIWISFCFILLTYLALL